MQYNNISSVSHRVKKEDIHTVNELITQSASRCGSESDSSGGEDGKEKTKDRHRRKSKKKDSRLSFRRHLSAPFLMKSKSDTHFTIGGPNKSDDSIS